MGNESFLIHICAETAIRLFAIEMFIGLLLPSFFQETLFYY